MTYKEQLARSFDTGFIAMFTEGKHIYEEVPVILRGYILGREIYINNDDSIFAVTDAYTGAKLNSFNEGEDYKKLSEEKAASRVICKDITDEEFIKFISDRFMGNKRVENIICMPFNYLQLMTLNIL